MNQNWVLPPYYEVSFMLINNFKSSSNITDFIKKLETLNYGIKLTENNIISKIESYVNKADINIEFNIWINICGKKHSKIIFEYLSDEITQICFCFFEEDINKKELKKLKQFLKDLIIEFNGIVGMIGWETTCHMIFFDVKDAYPNKKYIINNIKNYTNNDIYKNNEKWLNGVEEIIWNENK